MSNGAAETVGSSDFAVGADKLGSGGSSTRASFASGSKEIKRNSTASWAEAKAQNPPQTIPNSHPDRFPLNQFGAHRQPTLAAQRQGIPSRR